MTPKFLLVVAVHLALCYPVDSTFAQDVPSDYLARLEVLLSERDRLCMIQKYGGSELKSETLNKLLIDGKRVRFSGVSRGLNGLISWTEFWPIDPPYLLFLSYSRPTSTSASLDFPSISEKELRGSDESILSLAYSDPTIWSYRLNNSFAFGVVPGVPRQNVASMMKTCDDIQQEEFEWEGCRAFQFRGNTDFGLLSFVVCPDLDHRIANIELEMDSNHSWRGKKLPEVNYRSFLVKYTTDQYSDDKSSFRHTVYSESVNLLGKRRATKSISNISLVKEKDLNLTTPPIEVPKGTRLAIRGSEQIRLVWNEGKAVIGFDSDAVSNLQELKFEESTENNRFESLIVFFLIGVIGVLYVTSKIWKQRSSNE